MDYVFFGFSSLCLGFGILLLFHLSERKSKPPRIWHLLLAGAATLFYYFLHLTVFREQMSLYYLFNTLPQVLLVLLLAVSLLKRGKRGKP